jgi:mannose-1-phosphate guanylyltransferase
VPIQGTPLLAIWLRLLEMHGITEVLVNVHYFHEQVVAFLASHASSVTVVTVHEPRLLGSAGTVAANRAFVEGEESFLIAYADNLTTVNLGRIIRFHGGRPETLTLGVVPTDRPREKGTVLVGPDGRVDAFEEKADQPRSNLANAGIYVARQALFDYLPRSAPAVGVLDFGHHILPRMIPGLAAYPIEEFLMDVGTPEDYQRAQATWPGLRA